MDSEYREPTWRAVLLTLAATILVIAGLVLVASYLLGEQGCVPSRGPGDQYNPGPVIGCAQPSPGEGAE